MTSNLTSPKKIALLCWLTGILLSALLALWVHQGNQRLYAERLAMLSKQVAALVEQRFALYEYGLRGARGAIVAAGGEAVSRETFAAYMATRDMGREFPGARGFGFIRRISRADEDRFLAMARAEGPADFSIRELGAHSGERFVIHYIYPLDPNRGATGLDVASEANRREAALASARDGAVRLTAPITLVQAGKAPRRGFLAFLPVYPRGAAQHTPEAREAAVLGWAYAPLVVDELLAELGPQLQEIGVRLTDAGEAAPFYESVRAPGVQALPGLPDVTQDLEVFGRRWRLQATALPALAVAARPLPAIAVGSAAAFIATALSLLLWVVLQRRHDRLLGIEADLTASPVSLAHFLRSQLARWAALASLALVLIYGTASYLGEYRRQLSEAQRGLAALVDERSARLKAAQESRRKTMLFLADVPPVQGLVRALPTGRDPLDGSTREGWEKRLHQIFIAHMNSSPEVYQARLIGVADGGRELVRVERRGQQLLATPRTALQPKGDRPYFSQTLALKAGQVWVSDLELNQENGKIEQPHRPTLRYSTPVYQPNGQVFGIVIVNVDVGARLDELAEVAPTGGALYVTGGAGDFLFHPDPARRFGLDLGKRHRWDDEFQPAALPHGDAQDRLLAWAGKQGTVVAATAVIKPNADSGIGTIRYTATLPLSHVESAVWSALVGGLTMPLMAAAAAWLLLYFYWASVQRQLQVTRQRLRLAAIVDQSMDAIIGLDAEKRVSSWNRGASMLFGRDEPQALGQPFLELVGAPAGVAALLEAGGGAESRHVGEFEYQRRDGQPLQVALSWSGPGKGLGEESSAIVRDVTNERAAQRQLASLNRELEQQVQDRTASLAHERERLDNILRGTDAGTWEWHVPSGATVFNERWAEMLGFRLDELTPAHRDTWVGLVHPDDLPRSQALLQRHFDGEVPQYSCEMRMRHKSGRWVWVLSRGRLSSRTPDGEPEWMFGTHQDVSAIKEAELEVKRVAALLSSIFRAATELSIIATDAQGVITVFNTGAELMLGYRAEELVGVSSPAPLHLASEVAARSSELSAEYGMPVEGFRVFVHKPELEGAERREWTYVRKDGSHLPVSLVVTSVRNEEGRIEGYLGIAQDISERLRSESALRHAKAAAEAANSAKSMFLANMSHEIRTPMNAVIGVTHLLESSPLDGDQRQLLGKLQIAGRSLLGVINDVLDLSKIEAGEMSVDPAPMDPAGLLHELHQLFSPQTQAKGIALDLHGLDALPDLLLADESRLRQVLVNLCSNAIKFTATGGVSIDVQRETDAQGHQWLRWCVRDTGVGIAPEALGRLFDPFVQADASTTRRFGGTGLGLSIVRQLALLMGGEVGVQSTLGQGSEFWLRLPLVEVDPADRTQAGLPATAAGMNSGLDVVVVDDNDDDRRVLARLCRSLGWRPLELDSGAALMAHCKRLGEAGQELPDALLVDWQMPGIDGLQALMSVADELGRKRLPAALIISAHESEAIAALDHQQLVDQILTKPVGPSELFNAVNHSVSRHTGSTDRVVRSTRIDAVDAQWLSGLQVLIVDDSDINLEVARRLLEREGAVIATAVNGRQALAALRQEPERFDAVLMDVQMPEMDGYEATRLIRDDLGLHDLPVLALTAGALGEERRRAEAAGMNEFLTKPLDPQSLVRALRRAVESARGRPLPLAPGAQGSELPIDWPEIDGVDGRDAARRVGQDADLFLRMLERLLREFGSTSLAAGVDSETLMGRLHKLRGSAGLLGATEVHRLAGEAEAALRAGAAMADMGPAVAAVEQALRRLEASARPRIVARVPASSTVQAEGAPTAELTEETVAGLMKLLQQQDLAAAQQFRERAPALAARWGQAPFEKIRRAIEELDFVEALQLIEHAQSSPSSATQAPDRSGGQ